MVIMLLKIKSLWIHQNYWSTFLAPKLWTACSIKGFWNGVQIRFFDQAKYPSALVNASLKDDGDLQRQVKLLYRAVDKLRGSGVTDRGVNCLPGRPNIKTGPLLSLFLLRFFRFS